MSDIDKALAEIDLLAVADAVGVYRSGPVELRPDPRVGDTDTQRAARQRQAAARATSRGHRRRNARTLDEHLGTSRYPDIASTYPRVSLRPDGEPTDEQVREAANDLVRQGWDVAVVARLLNITPRS